MGKFLIFIGLLTSMASFAVSRGEVVAVSNSGRSLILNMGKLDGMRPGEKATLVRQDGTFNNPKLTYIGEGELIKSQDNYSYWYLKKINISELLKKGQLLQVLTIRDATKGIRSPDFLSRRVVLPSGKNLLEYRKESVRGIPDDIVFDEKNYKEGKKLVETYMEKRQDIEATNYQNWHKRNQSEYVERYMSELDKKMMDETQRPPRPEWVRDRYKKQVLDRMVENSIKKTNKLKYGLDGLYLEQKKDVNSKEFRDSISIENVYERQKKKEG